MTSYKTIDYEELENIKDRLTETIEGFEGIDENEIFKIVALLRKQGFSSLADDLYDTYYKLVDIYEAEKKSLNNINMQLGKYYKQIEFYENREYEDSV
jgi:hypothetical protein